MHPDDDRAKWSFHLGDTTAKVGAHRVHHLAKALKREGRISEGKFTDPSGQSYDAHAFLNPHPLAQPGKTSGVCRGCGSLNCNC